MSKPNLILKFKVSGESEIRLKEVAGLKIGGGQGFSFVDPYTGAIEVMPLENVELLGIQSLCGPGISRAAA